MLPTATYSIRRTPVRHNSIYTFHMYVAPYALEIKTKIRICDWPLHWQKKKISLFKIQKRTSCFWNVRKLSPVGCASLCLAARCIEPSVTAQSIVEPIYLPNIRDGLIKLDSPDFRLDYIDAISFIWRTCYICDTTHSAGLVHKQLLW